jgi:hypothetical protein
VRIKYDGLDEGLAGLSKPRPSLPVLYHGSRKGFGVCSFT